MKLQDALVQKHRRKDTSDKDITVNDAETTDDEEAMDDRKAIDEDDTMSNQDIADEEKTRHKSTRYKRDVNDKKNQTKQNLGGERKLKRSTTKQTKHRIPIPLLSEKTVSEIIVG